MLLGVCTTAWSAFGLTCAVAAQQDPQLQACFHRTRETVLLISRHCLQTHNAVQLWDHLCLAFAIVGMPDIVEARPVIIHSLFLG